MALSRHPIYGLQEVKRKTETHHERCCTKTRGRVETAQKHWTSDHPFFLPRHLSIILYGLSDLSEVVFRKIPDFEGTTREDVISSPNVRIT